MEKPEDTDQCHDIRSIRELAWLPVPASGKRILLDVKDPVHPKRVDAVNGS